MNIIPATLSAVAGMASITIDLPKGGTARLDGIRINGEAARRYDGKAVLAGIRPELIRSKPGNRQTRLPSRLTWWNLPAPTPLRSSPWP